MKIQVFEVIKQGIDLSFKDKKVLTLIVLFSILGIIFVILLKYLQEAAYPQALPVLGFNFNEILPIFIFIVSVIFLYTIVKATFENLSKRETSVSDNIVSILKNFIPTLFIMSTIYLIFLIITAPEFTAFRISKLFSFVAIFFCMQVISLNIKKIITSFKDKESYNIVKGKWLGYFTTFFIFFIVFILFGLSLGIFLLAMPFPLPLLTIIMLTVISFFISGVIMVVYTTIIYSQLFEKEKKIDEGVGSAEIVQ